jgi:hypothetical protein
VIDVHTGTVVSDDQLDQQLDREKEAEARSGRRGFKMTDTVEECRHEQNYVRSESTRRLWIGWKPLRGGVTMPLKVIPIGTPNLKDVPASLRMLAEKIESGDLPEAVHAIVVAVDADEAITIYGYGEVGTRAHTVGTLQMAVVNLANADY